MRACLIPGAGRSSAADRHDMRAPTRRGARLGLALGLAALLLAGSARAAQQPGRNRPTDLLDVRETEHFMIHYTLTGPDAVPNLAYIDVLAETVEVAWQAYHIDRPWDPPPGDGNAGGGWNKTDIYVHLLPGGAQTLVEGEDVVPPDPPYYDRTGFFHVTTTIVPANQLRVLAAHATMHIVQFGYSASPALTWFQEACAVLAEDWAYDGVNEYVACLAPLFQQPYRSLGAVTGAGDCAFVLWPMFISERYGVDRLEAIWECLRWEYSLYDCFDQTLAELGTDIDGAYSELMRWCYYTWNRDDGEHFEEAESWPYRLAHDRMFTAYPTGPQQPTPTRRPEPLGTSVMEFYPVEGGGSCLRSAFTGPACTAAVRLIAAHDGEYDEYALALDENGAGEITIPGFDALDDVTMLTSMGQSCTGAQDYVFWAYDQVSAVEPADEWPAGPVAIREVHPNPFTERMTVAYTAGSAVGPVLEILDASGRCVLREHLGWRERGDAQFSWDGRDARGRAVPSGAYVVRISGGGECASRMVVCLR
jgi:hypothetical protein